MGKFNKRGGTATAGPASPIATLPGEPTLVTHEGAPAFARTPQAELFTLGVNNFGGEETFYEGGKCRDARFQGLIRQVATVEPGWLGGFLPWLRGPANMRTAAVMGAADAAAAMLAVGAPGSRAIIAKVLQRGDEPGELVAYWQATYGRTLPKPVKAGINDALRAGLWTEYSLLKYDTGDGLRFGDILSLTRPVPTSAEQEALWRFALLRAGRDRGRDYTFDAPYERDTALRRFNAAEPMELLPMVRAQRALRERADAEGPGVLFDAAAIRAAGLTHEDVMSLAGKLPGGGKDTTARLWAALIPTMGYMALLRNLRRFDEACISDDAAEMVANRLENPWQVARSRQFPYRFLSAYEEAHALRWGPPLEAALTASLANLPVWEGRTLILVDTSGSMVNHRMSAKSKMTAQRAAAVFGVALALRNPGADLYGFANPTPFHHPVKPGMSLLREIGRFNARNGEAGHGTDIPGSIAATYRGHDRVVVISDMQTIGGPYGLRPGSGLLPGHVRLYGFSLGGYRPSPMPTGHQWHEFSGLNDLMFQAVPRLEAGLSVGWLWEDAPAAA